MKWRRVPPVASPIAPASLVAGHAAALGLWPPRREHITDELTRTFQAPEVLLTASGTEALILALRAVAPAGTTVAMPGYACIDLIAAAIGAGVRVALYDVDAETMSPDIASLRAVLDRGATAVVVAPLYGYPVDIRAVAALAKERATPVIEDAAQAAGATLDDQRTGSFGDLTVLSFGRGKGMTGGSGGALLVRKPTLLEWARKARWTLKAPAKGLRDVVALSAQWVLGRPTMYTIPASIPGLALGEMIYKSPREPAELSAAAAVVLRGAMHVNDAEVASRRRVAAELEKAASRSKRFRPIRPVAGAVPGYLRFAVVDAGGRAEPDPHLGALRGYPITLDEHVETRRILADGQADLPGARVLRDGLFTLPTHSMVTRADVARMTHWLSG
jgi:perosamine synthetase